MEIVVVLIMLSYYLEGMVFFFRLIVLLRVNNRVYVIRVLVVYLKNYMWS